ncbi:MAG: TetR/AcrR family transcriptional regulator [Planctomycetota bacterium]
MSQAREQLVEAATRVFGQEGFNASGIDRVLREAGVARQTLYHHFRSKDDLIVAALRRGDERFRTSLARSVERITDDPCARLLALFDVLQEWFRSDDFKGCIFSGACAEFAEADHPAHAVACEHKRLVRGYVRELVDAAAAARDVEVDADSVTDALRLLMDGATAQATVSCSCQPASVARRLAGTVLDSVGLRP